MSEKINGRIIGLGNIAAKFAADLQYSETSQLYGVASRNLNKAKKFSTKCNAQKYYGSYQALANDPEIDIIYVATPHVFHFENTMMCLKQNKAVLCEKPMGMNAKEAFINGTTGTLKLHRRFHHTEKITHTHNDEDTILDIKYKGNGYIHEIEEVNSCFFNRNIESSKLPLQMTLDLSVVMDTIKDKIGLKYDSQRTPFLNK